MRELWGRLLQAVVGQLDRPRVIGLTATPPSLMTAEQAELHRTPVGGVDLEVSAPALVREGRLAPDQELAFFTRPSPAEADYIHGAALRFAGLRTGLLDPDSAPSRSGREAAGRPIAWLCAAEPDLVLGRHPGAARRGLGRPGRQRGDRPDRGHDPHVSGPGPRPGAAARRRLAGQGGPGAVVYTGSPEGTGILAAQGGDDPFAVTTQIRTLWR